MAMTTTGTTFAVSIGQPATLNKAGFEALTWTTVGGVTNIDPYGPTSSDVTTNHLADGVTRHYKGFADLGDAGVTVDYDAEDAGQDILRALAYGASKNVTGSYRITMQDGSIDYLRGQVFTSPKTVGAANAMVTQAFSIKVNEYPVEVAAP